MKKVKKKNNGGWKYLKPVAWRPIFYHSLSWAVRNWPHGRGSFFYRNAEFLWDSTPMDIQGLFERGVDGTDHSLHDFFSAITRTNYRSIIYDPLKRGKHFAAYKNEWNNVKYVYRNTDVTGVYR